MSMQPASSIIGGVEGGNQPGMQHTTRKLLATQGYVVGIEISGSGVRQSVALADLDGNILYRTRRPLKAVPDSQTVLRNLDEMLQEVTLPERIVDGRILRVGVAVGGLVDAKKGIVQMLHHASGWDNFPLQDYFSERLQVPCIIDNNANAAALAEVERGAGVDERVVFYVGLGRGIGGGLVVQGRIYHGTTSSASEIGHLLVQEDGPPCSCGGFGHLEAIASAQAIVQRMLHLSRESSKTADAIGRLTDNKPEDLTAQQVFSLAEKGDMVAQHIIKEVHTYLGNALVNIVHIVNPSMIILGGPVALAGDALVGPLEQHIQKLSLPSASQSLRVVPGSLGSQANLVGAITLALQDL